MKKEVKNEIYIERSIQDAIEKKARQGWLEYNLLRENKLRKERTKERILATIIGAFIIATTVLILMLNSKLTQDAKESCMSSGHSESYCMERI